MREMNHIFRMTDGGSRRLKRASFPGAAAFTLLEVVIAVMILALIGIGMMRYVQSTLQAIDYSVRDTEENIALERLVSLIQEELYSISPRGQSSILGEQLKTGGKDFDTLEWRSRGGPGLMTTAALGEYRVQLMMKPLEKATSRYEIGIKRRPALLDTAGGLVAGGSDKDATWVPLLPNVIGLRFRYWDGRIGQLVERWTEPAARPAFVVLSILREGEEVPYEAVLQVPAAMTQQ